MQIKRIRIQGFKSLEDVTFEPEKGFSCLVGSNGAGKSNFCDALLFFKNIILNGVSSAIDVFGDLTLISNTEIQSLISFDLEIESDGIQKYSLQVDLDTKQIVLENLRTKNYIIYNRNINETQKLSFDKLDHFFNEFDDRKKNFIPRVIEKNDGEIDLEKLKEYNSKLVEFINFSRPIEELNICVPELFREVTESLSLDKTGLSSYFETEEIFKFIQALHVYRINPIAPKIPNKVFNKSNLLMYGENLATILSELKKDDEKWQTLHDWLSLIVPSISEVQVRKGEFDNSLNLQFIENNKALPAISISDGTIYTLAILTAVLLNIDKKTLIVIEEPERGIHPQAITELINFIREATKQSLNIITTTHSETFVRNCKLEELWVVDKIEGKTQLKSAKKENPQLEQSSLDQAWLMNLFNGGLPW